MLINNLHLLQHYKLFLKKNKIFLDPIRGNNRIENYCAFLHLLLDDSSCSKKLILEIINKIVDMRVYSDGYEEFGYQKQNENVGYWGLIPTSFAIITLTRVITSYKEFNSKEIHYLRNFIINLLDQLYFKENNGSFNKAYINKSNVLNTNLLCGYAFLYFSTILDPHSIRRRLYYELSCRVLIRVLKLQSFNGSFPYHEQTLKSPINYHSMVIGILSSYSEYISDQRLKKLVLYSHFKGMKYFKKNIDNEGVVKWSSFKKMDKHGASWTSSWVLKNLDKKTINRFISMRRKVEKHNFFGLSELEPNNNPDIFFQSWYILGTTISKEINNETFSTIWFWLKLYFIFNRIFVFWLLSVHKVKSIFLPLGAYENREWND